MSILDLGLAKQIFLPKPKLNKIMICLKLHSMVLEPCRQVIKYITSVI